MKRGWQRKVIKDLVEPLITVDPRNEPSEEFNYIDVSSVSRDTCSITGHKIIKGHEAPSRARRLVKAGDVLFATIRPTLKRIAVVPEGLDGAVCSTGFFVLRPREEVFSQYLFYSLLADEFSDRMKALQRGASYPAVSDRDVKVQEILVPPLSEQKRIVAMLDEAFAGIEAVIANTEKNLANARELFGSQLQNLFGKLYSKNKIVTLSDLASDITDGDHMPPPKSEEGIPFVTIRNIDKAKRKIEFDGTFRVPISYFENLKHNRKPKKGDVLYTVTGSYGIPVVVDHDEAFCFQRHIGLIRPSDCLDSKWLSYLLLAPQVTSQADERATGTA